MVKTPPKNTFYKDGVMSNSSLGICEPDVIFVQSSPKAIASFGTFLWLTKVFGYLMYSQGVPMGHLTNSQGYSCSSQQKEMWKKHFWHPSHNSLASCTNQRVQNVRDVVYDWEIIIYHRALQKTLECRTLCAVQLYTVAIFYPVMIPSCIIHNISN